MYDVCCMAAAGADVVTNSVDARSIGDVTDFSEIDTVMSVDVVVRASVDGYLMVVVGSDIFAVEV